MQKSLSDMAKFIKELIPANIPEIYSLKPMLKKITNEGSIQKSILAFRDFLYQFYDCVITEGSLYEKPLKISKNDDSGHEEAASLAVGYPFLNNVTSILINIGYEGKLNSNDKSLLLNNWQSLTSIISATGGLMKQKISIPKVIEYLRFLTSCGFCFGGIDLNSKKTDLENLMEISYPDNPNMLTGLKIMSIAHREFSTNNDYYVFQRCDYKALLNEAPNVTAFFKDYIYPLSVKVQKFIFNLHQHYLSAGLICKMKMHYFGVIFSYSYKSNVLWDFMPSPDGSRIFTKAKNMDKYADVLKNFPLILQKKISRGYGCEKKLFGEPCQKGCHGFSFLLDDSILEIGKYIEEWLDQEISCLKK
jgi:hypothetical protein